MFTNLDKGVKYVSVELFGIKGRQVRRFNFVANVPDLNVDYTVAWRKIQSNELYKRGDIQNLDETTFRTWIERLPCCVLGGDRKTPGDPLNVIFVGEVPTLFPALVRRGWHVTETITVSSVLQTISSSVFGERFRYGPVSPLYCFGRHQDVALQKARASVNECLAAVVDSSLGGTRVVRELERLVSERAIPEIIVSDNGTELTSAAVLQWASGRTAGDTAVNASPVATPPVGAPQDPSKIPLIPQDLTKREYFCSEVPKNGHLCWDLPAQQILDFVRACDFFPFQ